MKLAIPSRLVFALLLSAAISAESSSDGAAATTDHNLALRHSSSPYLQQHADNPVAWLPYSPDLISNIQSQQKLVFLSIGYSTCHWCHVMNRESFQDMEVAQVLNKSFISVKIDREQYPDADQYYNDLLVLSGGTAGWPLSGILLPDGTPVWLGNYVKKERLIALLTAFSEHFERDSPDIEMQAGIYRQLMTRGTSETNQMDVSQLGFNNQDRHGENLLARQDVVHGGVKGQQKFPDTNNIEMLWWYFDETGDKRFKKAAIRHLDGILAGTLYDPLFGGFFRYATTPDWNRPHFEKMLYTQAQLLYAYTEGYQRTRNDAYLLAANQTNQAIHQLFRADTTGLYYSAIDSEHNGEDGGVYLVNDEDRVNLENLVQGVKLAPVGKDWLIRFDGLSAHDLKLIQKFGAKKGECLKTCSAKDKKIITEWNMLLARGLIKFSELQTQPIGSANDAKRRGLALIEEALRIYDEEGQLTRLMARDFSIPASDQDWMALCSAISQAGNDKLKVVIEVKDRCLLVSKSTM